jgi:hypothetical protein
MTAKRKQKLHAAVEESEQLARKPGLAVPSDPQPQTMPTRIEDPDDESDFELCAETGEPTDPDPRSIDDLTDRIFDSVLSRFGWARHGERLVHTGEVRER